MKKKVPECLENPARKIDKVDGAEGLEK